MVTKTDINSLDRTYWPYGFHGQVIRWQDAQHPNIEVGRWVDGTLGTIKKKFGLPKNHGALYVLKAMMFPFHSDAVPTQMIAQMREAVAEGYQLVMQLCEYDQNGYSGPLPQVESTPIVTRARRFAKYVQSIVGTKRVILCYGNEWSYSGGTPPAAWIGTEEEWHEMEAACSEVWMDMGWMTGVGSDPDSDQVSASLESRAAKLRARGINPRHVPVLWHSYGGVQQAPPYHAQVMADRVAQMGFGASIWAEAAVFVNPNPPPSPNEVTWLAHCAIWARKSESGLCHFTVFKTHDDYAMALRKVMEAKSNALDAVFAKFPIPAIPAGFMEAAAVTSGKIASGLRTNAWKFMPEGRAAYNKTKEIYGGQH